MRPGTADSTTLLSGSQLSTESLSAAGSCHTSGHHPFPSFVDGVEVCALHLWICEVSLAYRSNGYPWMSRLYEAG